MAKILEVKNVTKLYPGVVALDDVSFDVEKGEILALIGENGAGKSTVIKTISGAIQTEKGTIIIDGKEYQKLTPSIAKEAGIGVVYQEFNLVPSLSIAENVFLGDKVGPRRGMPDFGGNEETFRGNPAGPGRQNRRQHTGADAVNRPDADCGDRESDGQELQGSDHG